MELLYKFLLAEAPWTIAGSLLGIGLGIVGTPAAPIAAAVLMRLYRKARMPLTEVEKASLKNYLEWRKSLPPSQAFGKFH